MPVCETQTGATDFSQAQNEKTGLVRYSFLLLFACAEASAKEHEGSIL